jgi:hypothetical protein
MNKKFLNLALFSAFILFMVSLPMIFVDRYLPQSQHPWQLQPFGNDSLSSFYKDNYLVVGDTALMEFLQDSSRTTVNILVDGWGVPYDEELLVQDFKLFKDNSAKYAIHKRMFGFTAIVESGEFGKDFAEGVFLSNGDSSTCNKKQQNMKRYFSDFRCFEGFEDKQIVSVLDSLLADGSWSRVGWTTYGTREGDREKLHLLLDNLSQLAKRYPQVQFIVQGTHRPIFGAPEVKRKYLAPWVPAVFLNNSFVGPTGNL